MIDDGPEFPDDINAVASGIARDLPSTLRIENRIFAARVIARALMDERERVGLLVDEKAQAFVCSRNPLASEMVSALDDLRLCVVRGESSVVTGAK